MQKNEKKKDYKVLSADSMGNDIFVISDVVDNADTAGWYYCMSLWGKWSKNQIFYNQNPPINAMDSHIDSAIAFNPKTGVLEIDSKIISGTKEKTTWFMNASKTENCKYYENAEDLKVSEIELAKKLSGKTIDELPQKIVKEKRYLNADKITPFKIGNYEVTQDLIDQNPDEFKSLMVNDESRTSANIYKLHPEIKRITQEIFDVYLPYCNEIVGKPFKKDFTNAYINRNAFGDSCWTHADPLDYSLIVYLNPDSYDLRKWGGETLFFNHDITLGRGAVTPKGSTACLFKGDIPHKVTSVSWEAEFDRIAITYFLELDND